MHLLSCGSFSGGFLSDLIGLGDDGLDDGLLLRREVGGKAAVELWLLSLEFCSG
jgi:hypothetical protein